MRVLSCASIRRGHQQELTAAGQSGQPRSCMATSLAQPYSDVPQGLHTLLSAHSHTLLWQPMQCDSCRAWSIPGSGNDVRSADSMFPRRGHTYTAFLSWSHSSSISDSGILRSAVRYGMLLAVLMSTMRMASVPAAGSLHRMSTCSAPHRRQVQHAAVPAGWDSRQCRQSAGLVHDTLSAMEKAPCSVVLQDAPRPLWEVAATRTSCGTCPLLTVKKPQFAVQVSGQVWQPQQQ
jgi:hypothetical protein